MAMNLPVDPRTDARKDGNKKVLFVLHLPPPLHGASVVGQYIRDSRLINQHFDTAFINLSASAHLKEIGRFNLKKFLFSLRALGVIFWTALRRRPALCYLTPTSGGWGLYRDYILVKLLRLLNVRVLLHFHNKASEEWIQKGLRRYVVKSFFKGVNVVLLAEELYAERAPYVARERVFICPNGIASVATEIPNREVNRGIITFLFLSNMMEEKGVYILLEACAMLRAEGYRFRCDFVGGWKDVTEAHFRTKVGEHKLNAYVGLHGAKYGEDKKPFWEAADVFVFPTYYENECFPLVLLEAMDYALPCISTDNGAIRSIIVEGKTGFCIPQRSVNALLEKMRWMIQQPDMRVEMGKHGKERLSRNFTLQHFEQRMFGILEENLKNTNDNVHQ